MIPALADTLACYRLTKLAIDDEITRPLRERIWRTHPADHGIGFLVACPYCASVWIAAGVVAMRRVIPRAWSPVAELLAMAAIAGEVAARLP